ncbi:hypothetical protein AVEN_146059-1 [Araneus ventricosus]|uniref:Uncharacterized protein n=1 Tax=Araneus ventricosus TaxID=182803 RepID=A0A4Y2N3E7_ARAVE|nr:hypothetical protein AVEN_146059-1 [Araneus ventricosus]
MAATDISSFHPRGFQIRPLFNQIKSPSSLKLERPATRLSRLPDNVRQSAAVPFRRVPGDNAAACSCASEALTISISFPIRPWSCSLVKGVVGIQEFRRKCFE